MIPENAKHVRTYGNGTEVFCVFGTGIGYFGATNTIYHKIMQGDGSSKITEWSGFYDDGEKMFHFLESQK